MRVNAMKAIMMGTNDSQHGLDDKFRRLRTRMRYHNRNRYKPYKGSNYCIFWSTLYYSSVF